MDIAKGHRMTINHVDRFRARIASGQPCIGTGITFSDPAISELVGDAGYDFTWIDMEHCPIDVPIALGHVMAVRGTGCAPLIRVPSGDPDIIKPILELHPAGIVVPQVRSVADVERVVAACKYPPVGNRGFGPRRGRGFGGTPYPTYLQDADEQILVFVQIENMEAVDALDGILQVAGLDGVCLGFSDLAGSMGLPGQQGDERVVEVGKDVVRRTRQTDKWMGLATGWDPVAVPAWIELGVQWISIGGDFNNLFAYASDVLNAVRETSDD
jgi:2-keto-3-deoxy-L-rhamnonate aldolase RhmA